MNRIYLDNAATSPIRPTAHFALLSLILQGVQNVGILVLWLADC